MIQRREDVTATLREQASNLQERFHVRRLVLFGSIVRGEARGDSDVDVFVEFEGDPTFDRYMDLKFHLEAMLGRTVDLVTPGALRPPLRSSVEREGVRVA